jgi:hypothetical protein
MLILVVLLVVEQDILLSLVEYPMLILVVLLVVEQDFLLLLVG